MTTVDSVSPFPRLASYEDVLRYIFRLINC